MKPMPTLAQLRREVYEANLGVHRSGLVTMHSGNASGIDRRRPGAYTEYAVLGAQHNARLWRCGNLA